MASVDRGTAWTGGDVVITKGRRGMSARRADDTDSGRRSQDLARDSASEEPKKKWYQFGKRPDSAHRGALEQAAKDQPQDEKRTTADKGKGGLLGSIPKLGARRSKVDDMTVIHVKPAKSSTSSAVDSWTPSGSSFSVTSQPAARKPAAGPAVPLSSDANVIATASTFVPVTAPSRKPRFSFGRKAKQDDEAEGDDDDDGEPHAAGSGRRTSRVFSFRSSAIAPS